MGLDASLIHQFEIFQDLTGILLYFDRIDVVFLEVGLLAYDQFRIDIIEFLQKKNDPFGSCRTLASDQQTEISVGDRKRTGKLDQSAQLSLLAVLLQFGDGDLLFYFRSKRH